MARVVLTSNAVIKVGGVDLSDHIASVTYESSVDEVSTTAFGDTGQRRVGGLKDESVALDFHQDNAASSVEQTIQPLLGGTASIVIKPLGTAVATSPTNPSYTATVLVTEWTPLNGAVGDLATVSVTWPVSGTIAYGTA